MLVWVSLLSSGIEDRWRDSIVLPRSVRTLSIGIYLLIAWKFLSLGIVVGGGAILLSLQGDMIGPLLLLVSAFFNLTGWMAFDRLNLILKTPYL